MTYAYDQRGHGGAPGFGDWPGEAALTADLADVVRLLEAQYPETPIFLAGLSFGATVVAGSIGEPDFPTVDGAILIAPAVRRTDVGSFVLRHVLGVAARLLPHAAVPAFADPGTYVPQYVSDSLTDPLIMKRMKVHFAYAGIEYIEAVAHRAERIRVPTLVLYGRKDGINPESRVIDLLERIAGPKRLVIYPEAHHVLIWDEQREIVLREHRRMALRRGAFSWPAPASGLRAKSSTY